jgi:hypothetical protein
MPKKQVFVYKTVFVTTDFCSVFLKIMFDKNSCLFVSKPNPKPLCMRQFWDYLNVNGQVYFSRILVHQHFIFATVIHQHFTTIAVG